MTKLGMLVDNQNLRKMLDVMREDISKNCVDCENKLPYTLRYIPENPALAHMESKCKQCVFMKYRKDEELEKTKFFNVKPA